MSLLLPDPVEWLDTHWVHDKMSSTPGERWRIADAPFLADIIRDYADPGVGEIALMCAAQGAKSTTSMACIGYSVGCAPDTIMQIMPSQVDVEEMGERLIDSLNTCAITSRLMPTGRFDAQKDGIDIPSGMLILKGAGGKGNKVSSKPIGRGHIDEEKDMDPVAVQKFLKRLRSRGDSAKLFRVSTPAAWQDSIHQAFLAGDQRRWMLRCPACGQTHRFGWRLDADTYLLKWDEHENQQDLLDSIRYEFPCGHKTLYDTEADRRWIVEEGDWHATNPQAESRKHSYTWSALLPLWVRWHSVVSEWLVACNARKNGDLKPLHVFITETIGEPNEQQEQADPISLSLADYKLADYQRDSVDAPLKLIDSEKTRVMAVDYQQGAYSKGELPHRWAVVRAIRYDGSARLLWEGRIDTHEEQREIQLLMGVIDKRVFCDIGWDREQVLKECIAYNWTGIRGDDGHDKSFIHHVNGKKVWKLHGSLETAQVGRYQARFIRVAKQRILDIYARLRVGADGAPLWEVGQDVSKTYLAHQGGLVRKEVKDKNGNTRWAWTTVAADHLMDCDYYALAAAAMFKLVGNVVDTTEESDSD